MGPGGTHSRSRTRWITWRRKPTITRVLLALRHRWVLWVALAILMGDSLTSLALLIGSTVSRHVKKWRSYDNLDREVASGDGAAHVDPAGPHEQVPTTWWVGGLLLSCAVCIGTTSSVFGMPVYETLVAVLLALVVAVLAVRALGETDLNPVSGVAKLSQVCASARWLW